MTTATMIRFRCDYCGKTLKSSPETVGKSAKCPGCHARTTVPAPREVEYQPSPYELIEVPPVEDHDAGDYVLQRRRSREKAAAARRRFVLWFFFVGFLIGAAIVLVPRAADRLEEAGYHGLAGPLFGGIALAGGLAFALVRVLLKIR